MRIENSTTGKTRDLPVADSYLADLDTVLRATDPRLGARIVSAGQSPKGSGGKRTGSTRHDVDDTGHAHTSDLVLTLDGEDILPGDHKDIYAKFLKNAAGKFPGVGHYSWGVHIGGGSPAMWGPDTTSKSVDPIFAKAISEGRGDIERRPLPAVVNGKPWEKYRTKAEPGTEAAPAAAKAKPWEKYRARTSESTKFPEQADASEFFDADRFGGPAPKGDRVIPASRRGELQGTELSAMERVGNALYDAGKAIGLPVDRMRRDNASLDAAVRGAADTASFGLADEFAAAADSVTGLTGERGNYSGNLDYQRAQDRYDAETNPVARTTGQIGGGVATGVAAAPRAASKWWGRLAQNSLLGGVYGGAYGFGSGEGGFENRRDNAFSSARDGALIGVAIPAAIEGTRGAYKAVNYLTTKPVGNVVRGVANPSGNAMRLANRALARDGLMPEDAAARMQTAIDAGDDSMMLMDVAGDNVHRLGKYATNIPGQGAQKIQSAVHDRQLAQPERIIGAIQQGLDDPGRYFATIDDIIAQRQKASKPLYDKAWETPVPFTRKLESLLGRGKVMRDALKRARDLGEAEGIPSKQFFARIADDGSYTIESVPDARQWDLMKRSLDDIIDGEKTILPNGTEKLSNLGRIVFGIKREMLEEIDRVNPDYAAARKVYSSASESLDSVEQGKKLLDADPELARRKLADMSEGDKQLARLGLSKAMSDRIMRMKDGANTVRAIFASPKHRAVLKAAFPDEKSFTAFEEAMTREAQKTKTKQAIQGNSSTTRQVIDAADAQDVDEALLNSLATGGIRGAAMAVVRKALSRAVVVNEATAKELANILTTTDPKVANQIIERMQMMAMKNQRSAKNWQRVRDVMRKGGIVAGTGQSAQPAEMPPAAPPRILGQDRRQPLEITVGPVGGP
ncbi:hypothetical protein ABMA32_03635 [Mesorhizobium sp. VNQ89]|uniref:hypothetical protein n=1 Tax=Mesorhizobium quangtriensis TaxID=3157709 RepID=UPI0032B792D5